MADKEEPASAAPTSRGGSSPLVSRLDRWIGKPLYYLYYGWLYPRSLPGSRALAGPVEAWERRQGRRDAPMSRTDWEREYGSGDWDYLAAESEAARYRWLVDAIVELAPGRSVLDLGCGEAVLGRRLADEGPAAYFGVDVSSIAIQRAREASRPGWELGVAEVEEYEPGRRFDVVVLNEVLYYLHDPIGQAHRCRGFLEPGGVLLLSVFESLRTRALLRRLRSEMDIEREQSIEGPAGSWRMVVIRS